MRATAIFGVPRWVGSREAMVVVNEDAPFATLMKENSLHYIFANRRVVGGCLLAGAHGEE